MTRLVGNKWKSIFEELENYHFLNKGLARHKWLLSYLFLPLINEDLKKYQGQHNVHGISTARNLSPEVMFYHGMLEHGFRGLDWRKPGNLALDGEEDVDVTTYADGDGVQPDGETGFEGENDFEDQVRGYVRVDDQRCPFSGRGWEQEMQYWVARFAEGSDLSVPSNRWKAGLDAMAHLLDAGYGR